MVQRAQVLSKVTLFSARRLFTRDASNKLFAGVKVICDRKSGKSKGFGFVQFSQESEAASALQKMDEQPLDGRNIRVEYANKE